jgi:hypothetical protein
MISRHIETLMNRKTFIAAMAATFFVASVPAETPKTDFSGSWELQQEKSEGVPPGMHQVLIVKQSGDRLDVDVKLSGTEGDRTIHDVYVLDGKEAEFVPPVVSGGTPKGGKRTTTLSKDGRGFDATEEAMVEGPEGTDTFKGKRTWRVSEDGKQLTVDVDLDAPQGPIKSKRVFARK